VPVEFLADAEAASYGRYNEPPRAELERAFSSTMPTRPWSAVVEESTTGSALPCS